MDGGHAEAILNVDRGSGCVRQSALGLECQHTELVDEPHANDGIKVSRLRGRARANFTNVESYDTPSGTHDSL